MIVWILEYSWFFISVTILLLFVFLQRSGRIEEEIKLLELKLKSIEEGIAFGGKKTKIARSQGKKVHITIEKEYSRLYLQLHIFNFSIISCLSNIDSVLEFSS